LINSPSEMPRKTVGNILGAESNKRYDDQIETWIREAKAGSSEALGALISACRNYLLAIANRKLSGTLKAKVGNSDLVQETAVDVVRDFDHFEGERRDELLAWLRQILLHNAANVDRRFRVTSKRQISREISLTDVMDVACHQHDPRLASSGIVSSLEVQARVEQAISRLPNNMKNVILMRNRENFTFAEIGARLGCSSDAARNRWARAIERLQAEMVPIDDRGVS
jgi:RNA polymerase sigma-70 factor, ECF subfamily